MDPDRGVAVTQFASELGDLLERWWPQVGPPPAAGSGDGPAAFLASAVPVGWVLVVGAGQLDPDSGACGSILFHRPGQWRWVTQGLISDVARWQT